MEDAVIAETVLRIADVVFIEQASAFIQHVETFITITGVD
jgi:hypothetical protein